MNRFVWLTTTDGTHVLVNADRITMIEPRKMAAESSTVLLVDGLVHVAHTPQEVLERIQGVKPA